MMPNFCWFNLSLPTTCDYLRLLVAMLSGLGFGILLP